MKACCDTFSKPAGGGPSSLSMACVVGAARVAFASGLHIVCVTCAARGACGACKCVWKRVAAASAARG